MTLLHTHLSSWEDQYELFITHEAAVDALRAWVHREFQLPRSAEMPEAELKEICLDHGHSITIVDDLDVPTP